MPDKVIFQTLRMEKFGCFQDETVKFAPGLNQLIGPNESGKSTIIRALFTALFEDGSTKKQTVTQLRNWADDRPFRLTLTFSAGPETFTLIRDYEFGHDVMTDSSGFRYEGKQLTEKLSEIFGAVNRGLYEAVHCFSSDFPMAMEKQRERLKAALEMPVFSGFNRVRADQYLDDEIKKLDNPLAHGPTEIETVGSQISSRLQEKSAMEERLTALQGHRQELVEIQASQKQYEGEVEKLEREIAGAESYRQLNDRMANLEERLHLHLTSYSRAAQVAEDLDRIQTEVSKLTVPEPEVFEALLLNRDVLSARVDEAKQKMDTLIARRSKANLGFIVSTALLVAVCLSHLGLQLGHWDRGSFGNIILFAIPVITTIWLLRTWIYYSLAQKKKLATELFRKEVAGLDAFYADLNTRFDLKAADPIKAIEELHLRREHLLMSAENLRRTIDHLSNEKGVDYLINVKKQLEIEVASINAELMPVVPFAPAAARLPELKENLTARRVRANAFREQAALLTERCSSIKSLEEQIVAMDSEVEALKRKHNEITDRIEILKITRIALNRAADHLIEETFAGYGAEASAVVSNLTGGRYQELRFTNESACFEVKEAFTGHWMEISDALSASTRDALYLALRVAAAVYLAPQCTPPMIFDQAESRMDDQRKGRFFELLTSLSETRQIISVGVKSAENLPGVYTIPCIQKHEFQAAVVLS
jgi:DNA repair exonuclease SbcCD ATPase subunit